MSDSKHPVLIELTGIIEDGQVTLEETLEIALTSALLREGAESPEERIEDRSRLVDKSVKCIRDWHSREDSVDEEDID